jgi:Glyoxalase-like domain
MAPTIIFVTVPEPKTLKNRIHIDVSPIDRAQDEEVQRLIEMGARHVDIGQGEQNWIVLADPRAMSFASCAA